MPGRYAQSETGETMVGLLKLSAGRNDTSYSIVSSRHVLGELPSRLVITQEQFWDNGRRLASSL